MSDGRWSGTQRHLHKSRLLRGRDQPNVRLRLRLRASRSASRTKQRARAVRWVPGSSAAVISATARESGKAGRTGHRQPREQATSRPDIRRLCGEVERTILRRLQTAAYPGSRQVAGVGRRCPLRSRTLASRRHHAVVHQPLTTVPARQSREGTGTYLQPLPKGHRGSPVASAYVRDFVRTRDCVSRLQKGQSELRATRHPGRRLCRAGEG